MSLTFCASIAIKLANVRACVIDNLMSKLWLLFLFLEKFYSLWICQKKKSGNISLIYVYFSNNQFMSLMYSVAKLCIRCSKNKTPCFHTLMFEMPAFLNDISFFRKKWCVETEMKAILKIRISCSKIEFHHVCVL